VRIKNLVIRCTSVTELNHLVDEYDYIGAPWRANYDKLTLTILARQPRTQSFGF
jgi:hypothetical protein